MAVQLRHGLIGRVDLKAEQSGRYKQTVAYFDLDGEPMVYQGEYIPYVGPRTPIPPGFEQGDELVIQGSTDSRGIFNAKRIYVVGDNIKLGRGLRSPHVPVAIVSMTVVGIVFAALYNILPGGQGFGLLMIGMGVPALLGCAASWNIWRKITSSATGRVA
jgi:hypothetical protein